MSAKVSAVATTGARAVEPHDEIVFAMIRHIGGDCGEVDEEDRDVNEHGLIHALGFLSVYLCKTVTKFWFLTDTTSRPFPLGQNPDHRRG